MRAEAMLLSLCIVSMNISGCGLADSAAPGKGKSETRSSDTEPDPDDAKSDQKDLEELLGKKKVEAREWLANPKSVLWKGDRKQILDGVKAMYAAGAVKIYAVDILEHEGREVSTEFAVELPADKVARSRVINAHNKFWKKYLRHDDAEELKSFTVTDQGQKYLIMNFDL